MFTHAPRCETLVRFGNISELKMKYQGEGREWTEVWNICFFVLKKVYRLSKASQFQEPELKKSRALI